MRKFEDAWDDEPSGPYYSAIAIVAVVVLAAVLMF